MYCLVKGQLRQVSPLRISAWEGFLSQEHCHKPGKQREGPQRDSPFLHPGMWADGTFNHQGKRKNPFLWNLRLRREADFPTEIQNTVFFPERKKKWIKLPIFKDTDWLIYGSKEFLHCLCICALAVEQFTVSVGI